MQKTRMLNFMRVGMKVGTWGARGGDVLWTDVGRGRGRRVLVPWLRVDSGDQGGLGSTISHT